MKKFIFIILTCIIWFMLPTFSQAYTEEQKELFQQEYQEIYNKTLLDAWADYFMTIWENKGSTNWPETKYLYTYDEDGYYSFMQVNDPNRILSNGKLQIYSGDKVNAIYRTQFEQNRVSTYYSGSSNTFQVPTSYIPHYWGSFEEWNDSHIDYSWTNVSYDASIPTPSIDVELSNNLNAKYFNTPNTPMYGQLGPEIPYFIGFRGSEAYDGYYLYLDMTIWTPTSGELDLENGIYTFTPKSMLRTEDIAYLDWEDMKTAPTTSNFYYQTNAPLTGSTLLIDQQENLNTWYNIRRNIEDGTSDYTEMNYSTNLTGTARETGISRINQMLRNASLAGNRVRFRACLYYINENNEIKCGNFATWTSAQPSKPTSEQPSTNAQVVDQPASGITQTVSYDNVVSQNESKNNIPPVNVTTGGTNVNVTVNTGEQNVPNNQNYPTVVSYNHDNIFTTFIGTYNSASQYLGGFAQFCNSCLLWIPSEIWSIIGMGFAMALVIMIVKIL